VSDTQSPPEDPTPIRILLVDDHPLILDGLTLALDADGMSVVGAARTIAEARRLAAFERPDLILLDVQLPDGSGLGLLPELTSFPGHPKVIVLTLSASRQLVVRALELGATGYLVKGASRDEIVRSVRAVAAGQTVLGSSVSAVVLSESAQSPFPGLSPRESEILRLVAEGLDNSRIGSRLSISAKTVANAVSGILIKIGAADRSQAVLLAIERGLVPSPRHPSEL
jgi:DNA-binding NarL/FixJ family response regulator